MEALNFCIKEIAYDNGAVYRHQTEKETMDRVWLALVETSTNPGGFSAKELNIVEDALSQLTEDELRDIATDSQECAKGIIAKYNIDFNTRALIDEVLNHAFENL